MNFSFGGNNRGVSVMVDGVHLVRKSLHVAEKHLSFRKMPVIGAELLGMHRSLACLWVCGPPQSA
jgi:hypothetical protein